LIPLVIAGVYLFSKLPELKENISVPVASQAPLVTPTPINSASPANSSPQPDSFREAVNKATSAATITQSAKSKDDWNLVASQWQEAIALMKAVPSSHPYYTVAQQKSIDYQRNLDYAQTKAANGQ
jgi:ribosomal protein L31